MKEYKRENIKNGWKRERVDKYREYKIQKGNKMKHHQHQSPSKTSKPHPAPTQKKEIQLIIYNSLLDIIISQT
jgi:hypothetical protein